MIRGFAKQMAVALTMGGALFAVACGDGDTKVVEIESPRAGATLTRIDDIDPATEGVQIEVQVAIVNEDPGEEVWLYRDANALDGLDDSELPAPDAIGDLGDDGRLLLTLTLQPGLNTLLACTEGCSVRSRVVEVTLNDTCGGVVFIDPEPSAGTTTVLGATDDTVGAACGEEFGVDVRVTTLAPDGTNLQLFVNGAAGPTATAATGQARFTGVVLGNRGETTNTLAVSVATDEGTCVQDFPNEIEVRCDGASCAIAFPDPSQPFLNADDDQSDEPGFQTGFQVSSEVEQAGSPVRLIVDGDIDAMNSVPTGDAAVAEFASRGLSEGRHSVVAECEDSLGNVTRTAPVVWTVDTIACTVAVDSPMANDLFVDTDDLDSEVEGIQIDVSGTVSGEGCVSAVAGPCSAAGEPVTLSGGSVSGRATLGTSFNQELCVRVTDEAGNVGEGRVALQVRTEAPQLEIETPAGGARFNELGASGATPYEADLDPSTDDCEIAFRVLCTDLGETVELRQALTDAVLGSSTCVVEAGVPAPYEGTAVFDSVPISSFDDGSSIDVFARMEVDRVVGTSVPITLFPDCAEPDLDFFEPVCGSVLRPSIDDQNPGTPAFDYQIKVSNPTVNNVDATTLVVRADGTEVLRETSSTRSGQVILFNTAFPTGGALELEACATDPAGNTGCRLLCDITVADVASVRVTEPTAGSALNADDDCDPATAGLQIRVRGTTNAPDSATATVDVGTVTGQPATISGGMVDVCVDVQEGADVPVRLNVTTDAGTATATSVVDIDSQPPILALDDLAIASVPDRRAGIVRLQWTAQADTDGRALARTEVRCSSELIEDEADWTAASVFYAETAATPGAVVSQDVSGFATGEPCTAQCVRSTSATLRRLWRHRWRSPWST